MLLHERITKKIEEEGKKVEGRDWWWKKKTVKKIEWDRYYSQNPNYFYLGSDGHEVVIGFLSVNPNLEDCTEEDLKLIQLAQKNS